MATTQASLFDFGPPAKPESQQNAQPLVVPQEQHSAPPDIAEQEVVIPLETGLENKVDEFPNNITAISDEELLGQNYITPDFLPADDIELVLDASPGVIASTINTIRNSTPANTEKKSTRGRMKLSEMNTGADLINIPEDEELFQKSYYPIGAVSEMFKVNISLIRFWENEFDILKPRKNGKGDRHFRPEDIKNLKLIYHLLREKKYTIEGAKDFLKKNKKVEETFSVIESLKKLKGFLNEIRASL